MKILYIITQADGGGAQTYVLSLAKYFSGSVASGIEANKLFHDANAVGLNTYHLRHLKRNVSPWHDFLTIFEIANLIKKLQPDIVHLNSTKAGFLGSLAAGLLKLVLVFRNQKKKVPKIIFTAHGFAFLEPHKKIVKFIFKWVEKIASLFRDYIITVSNLDKNEALKAKIININKISTIYNGLPEIEFIGCDIARQKLNLTENKFYFGTMANFYKTKGLDILVKAVSLLDKNILENCRFVIIGSGPEFGNWKLEIGNLNLTKYFILPGNIQNAAKFLKAFNAFILPSRKEGFPYVILESMQAGLPIIATRVGGVPEALLDAGILVEPENPEVLSQAITKIYNDADLRLILGQKATSRAKEFSLEKMLKETEKIYKS